MFPFSLADVPLILAYIGVLVILEGLLSADNALVLALMVRHLPKSEQRRVLRYGIWGAIGFRVVAVLLAAILLKFWYVMVLGGGYLLYLAIKHFVHGESGATDRPRGWGSTFWGTVASVTFTDIAFSIDSILAAVAMAVDFPDRFGDNGKLFIVLVGGILGIITMRFVVRYFVILLDRFPGLARGAYFLVAWIGLKLVISGFHSGKYLGFHIPDPLFWSVMLAIAVISLLVNPGTKPAEMSHNLDLLDEEEALMTDETGNGEVAQDRPERVETPSEPEAGSHPSNDQPA